MNVRNLVAFAMPVIFAAAAFPQRPAPPGTSAVQLPEGTGKDTTQRVCGSTCHGPDIIMGKGRTRDQWTAVVNTMVGRGAKASQAELTQISEYLSSHFSPNMVVSAPAGRGNRSGAGPPVAS